MFVWVFFGEKATKTKPQTFVWYAFVRERPGCLKRPKYNKSGDSPLSLCQTNLKASFKETFHDSLMRKN